MRVPERKKVRCLVCSPSLSAIFACLHLLKLRPHLLQNTPSLARRQGERKRQADKTSESGEDDTAAL